ncbi:unnamed protein product [Prunus armeniaca]
MEDLNCLTRETLDETENKLVVEAALNLLGTKPPSILEFACVVRSMAWTMDLPKPPTLVQDLVLLENGDLRHKQKAHVSNPYYASYAK